MTMHVRRCDSAKVPAWAREVFRCEEARAH